MHFCLQCRLGGGRGPTQRSSALCELICTKLPQSPTTSGGSQLFWLLRVRLTAQARRRVKAYDALRTNRSKPQPVAQLRTPAELEMRDSHVGVGRAAAQLALFWACMDLLECTRDLVVLIQYCSHGLVAALYRFGNVRPDGRDAKPLAKCSCLVIIFDPIQIHCSTVCTVAHTTNRHPTAHTSSNNHSTINKSSVRLVWCPPSETPFNPQNHTPSTLSDSTSYVPITHTITTTRATVHMCMAGQRMKIQSTRGLGF